MTAIVTDSTISISRSEAQALGLFIVPDHYSIDGHAFTEGYADENGDAQARIFAQLECCKTSQPPVTAFQQAFQKLSEEGPVLCLTISSRLSGAYSSACMAAGEFPPGRVAVVDSLSTAGGLWLLAKAARGMLNKGMPLAQVARAVEALRSKTGIVFTVEDMAPLRRSGRLGVVGQSVGAMLNIRPVLLCVRGAVVAHGLARGSGQRLHMMVERVPPNAREIRVHYVGSPAAAQPLYRAVKRRFPGVPVTLGGLGPVLSIHLGPGTLGIAWMTG